MKEKVQAFIYRDVKGYHEILIFEHDITKFHECIRGTVEKDECLEEAILREVEEESGLKALEIVHKLGEIVFDIRTGPTRSGAYEQQKHHAYLLHVQEETLDHWTYTPQGSQVEKALKFHFYWHEVNDKLVDVLFDDFKPFVPKLINYFN